MKEFLKKVGDGIKKYKFVVFLGVVFIGMFWYGSVSYTPVMPVPQETVMEVSPIVLPVMEAGPTLKPTIAPKPTKTPKPTATPKMTATPKTVVAKTNTKSEEKNFMWFLTLIQNALAFAEANVVIVGYVMAVTAWLKTLQPSFKWLKSEYLTVAAFVLAFLFIYPGTPNFVVDAQFVANGVVMGLGATGIYKTGEFLAIKSFKGVK